MKNEKENYEFESKVLSDKGEIFLSGFTATMPLRESKVFTLEILKDRLIQYNAILKITINMLILHEDETYTILTKQYFPSEQFEIEILLDGLDSQLGCVVDIPDENSVIELENYMEEDLEGIFGHSIRQVIDTYNDLEGASWGKKIPFSTEDLLNEIIKQSLKTI